jgi:hypothetical protein
LPGEVQRSSQLEEAPPPRRVGQLFLFRQHFLPRFELRSFSHRVPLALLLLPRRRKEDKKKGLKKN